ncbi:hypothetical protein J7L48_01275 [bacterium]|nr:hypothetical protein [bacterium]
MKKLFLLLAIFMALNMIPFSDVHQNIKGKFLYSVKTEYFYFNTEGVYLRSYISIPLSSLKYEKFSTKKGQSNYRVKLKYDVVVYNGDKVIKKDSWKSIVNFQVIKEDALILNFYDANIPNDTKYKYIVNVTDQLSKKVSTFDFEETSPNFSKFNVSSLLWAKTDIKKAEPNDYKYLIFNNLKIYPISGNYIEGNNYPRLYFEIYGLTPDEDEFYKYGVEYDIFNAKNKHIYHFEIVNEVDAASIPVITPNYIFDILSLVDYGPYTVKIKVTDLNSNESIEKTDKIIRK